jgi:hypothetical protein
MRSVSSASVLFEVRVKSLTERNVAARLRAQASRNRSGAGVESSAGGSSSSTAVARALSPTRATSTTAASRQEGRLAMGGR